MPERSGGSAHALLVHGGELEMQRDSAATGSDIPGRDARQLGFRSAHPGGANILLTDGAVRFVTESINPETLHHLFTRNDGKPLGDF